MDDLINKVHCLEFSDMCARLPDKSIDAVITDPPYGLGGRDFQFPHKHYSAINEAWDLEVPLDWMIQLNRVLKPNANIVCFGVRQSIYDFAWQGKQLGWRLINDITWFKYDAPPNFTGRMMTESTERILWFCKSQSGWTYNLSEAKDMNAGINFRDVWECGTTKGERYHPAQKPLILIERLVRLLTNKGDLIFDGFCGSGTTALACANTGRNFICSDFTPEYVDIANERLERSDPYKPTRVSDTEVQLSLFS